eukprot:2154623-Pyramimonas_sp.AAC.1
MPRTDRPRQVVRAPPRPRRWGTPAGGSSGAVDSCRVEAHAFGRTVMMWLWAPCREYETRLRHINRC